MSVRTDTLDIEGDITVGVHGAQAALEGIAVERADDAIRVRLRAPIDQLRKLAALGPDFARLLVEHARAPPHATATLRLVAPPEFAREICAALDALGDATPQAWLEDPTSANLIFELDRYRPESIAVPS